MVSDRRTAERTILVTVVLGAMLAPLNSTMITVALPTLLGDFGRSLVWGSWIVASYLVAMAAFQPLGGSLGDRYGRRRLFLIGLMLFLVATVVAALSWSIEVLIVARTVQAVAGATAIPNGTALVRSLIVPERQGRAFGTVASALALAAGLGPPLGGVLTAALGWRWIFAANILLIAPALILGLRLPAVSSATSTGRFDLRGAALLICGLVSLVLALTVWRLPGVPLVLAPVLGLLAVGTSLALVLHTGRSPKPVLNLALFRARGFTPAATTVLLSNLTMYTLLLSLPVFLVGWGNWGDEHVGLLLAGLSLPMVFFSPLGGRLSDRSGRRLPAVMGMVLIALGTLPFLAIAPFWSWLLYLAPLVLQGIGLGLSTASVQATAIETVSLGQAGQAAGLFSTMRYLGSILGSSVMVAVLSGSTPPVENFRVLYAALLLSACGAIITAWGLPTWIRRAGDSETEP
ncbi:MAG: MFS transporter [Actinobacteria bacterium]|jgi:DHA2 family methylenomycin A resistance protein-like MFS transporter|nr:MFS transporter [Actinomycetota bacterium]